MTPANLIAAIALAWLLLPRAKPEQKPRFPYRISGCVRECERN